jgi:hypothetical protein
MLTGVEAKNNVDDSTTESLYVPTCPNVIVASSDMDEAGNITVYINPIL